MKTRILLLLTTLILATTSCHYHNDTRYIESDGRAFLSLFAGNIYPTYIDTDGALPRYFNWEEYYQVYPERYSIYYEYEYDNAIEIIVDAFEVNIEIWVNEGGEVRNRRSSAEDNYFNLDIFPDGYYDFYLDNLKSGSYSTNDIIKIIEKTDGSICFRATIKKVDKRIH